MIKSKSYKLIILFLFVAITVVLFTKRLLFASEASIKPNIIFIMADDHTSQAMGAYGGRLKRVNPTPILDHLASKGIVFKNVFSTNSACTPSWANIITGQYSQTNDVKVLGESLPKNKQYLPIEMRKLGYQTALIGKWHLKAEPNFDYYEVFLGQGKYINPELIIKGKQTWPQNLVTFKGHSSDVITDQSLKWLSNRDHSKPFFLMHHFKAPHEHFTYAQRYKEYLEDINIPIPDNLFDQGLSRSIAIKGKHDTLIHKIGTSISNKEATYATYQEYIKDYLRCVKGIDDNLGRLFSFLKKNNLWENTIIVYTSDQGMVLGEHDFQEQRWMYKESMRMPLIMHLPKTYQYDSINHLMINNTDIAPTLIEFAGGLTPYYMQGKSFANKLINTNKKNNSPFRKYTYFRYWMHLKHHDIPAHFGIRSDKYKLIFYYGMPFDLRDIGKPMMSWLKNSNTVEMTPVTWEFYDLSKDPHENNNVYNDPSYHDIITEMKVALKMKRETLNETDDNYPHIQKVIQKHWHDQQNNEVAF